MPRCIAYKADGTLCAGQGIELDEKRGGFVCAVHPSRQKELRRDLERLEQRAAEMRDRLTEIYEEQDKIRKDLAG